MIALVASIPAHKLDRGQPRARQEPAPDVVEEEAEGEEGVEADEEVHQRLIEHINMMLPDANDGDEHVTRSNEGVQNE